MGSYLQKPVVQKESYEGTGQEFGLHELDFSFFGNAANQGSTHQPLGYRADRLWCVDP